MENIADQAVVLDKLTAEQITGVVEANPDAFSHERAGMFTIMDMDFPFQSYTGLEISILFHISYFNGQPLIGETVEIPEGATEQTRYLLDLANQTVLHDNRYAKHWLEATTNSVSGACPNSELAFAGVVNSLEGTAINGPISEASHGGNPISIIVDDELMPLFLKKSVDSATAINLQPIRVNGVHFPAGMLMMASTFGDDGPDRLGKPYRTADEFLLNVFKTHEFLYDYGFGPELVDQTTLEDGSQLRVIRCATPSIHLIRQSMLTSEDPVHRRAITTFDEGKPPSPAQPRVELEYSMTRMQSAVAGKLAQLGIS